MPTVTIRIPDGGGSVRVSSKTQYETAYNLLGIASLPESDWSFGFWDNALFAASPDNGFEFEKFCADSNLDGKVSCGDKNKQMLEAEIDKSYDVLIAYFVPEPAKPPPPQNPVIDWIWHNLLWWLPK